MSDDLRLKGFDQQDADNVEWLWKNRLVKNALNLVVGNEGVGKGTLVAWILARVTRGKLTGNYWEEPQKAAIVGNEDAWNKVWVPRLASVGARRNWVYLLEKSEYASVDIQQDIVQLADVIQRANIQVLYFDQILDNLGDVDHYNTKEVRKALAPLHRVAGELGITVIATMHPNKRAESFRQLVNGSSAFNAIARSSLYVADHPEEEGVRVMLTAKTNYGIRGDALEFQIISDKIRPNGKTIHTSRVANVERSDITLDELMGLRAVKGAPVNDAITRHIREYLSDGNWHLVSDVSEELLDIGVAKRSIRRAATHLGVERKREGYQGSVQWRLAKNVATTKRGKSGR